MVISKRNREPPPAEGKGSLISQKHASAAWTGSRHFIWVETDAETFLCPSEERAQNRDKLWPPPAPPVSSVTCDPIVCTRPSPLPAHTEPSGLRSLVLGASFSGDSLPTVLFTGSSFPTLQTTHTSLWPLACPTQLQRTPPHPVSPFPIFPLYCSIDR